MYGCIVDVIIPTSLVYVLFDPAIPTSSFNFIQLLTLAAKRRRRVTAIVWRFLSVRLSVRLFVRPSVRPYGKGRLRESTHLRITGIKEEWSRSSGIIVCSCGCHSVPCWSVVNAVTV